MSKKAYVGVIEVAPPKYSNNNNNNQAITDQRSRTSWEDRSTGEYQRVNSREVVNDNGDYRRYTTVSWGNKSTGYSGKLHAEEKWAEPSPATQQKYYGGYSKNKYLD